MPSARLEARMDSLLSFPVGLFHSLQHAGFDPGARRGRDADHSTPPAQIRTGGTTAYGSYLRECGKRTNRIPYNLWNTQTPALCRETCQIERCSPWSTPFPPQPPLRTCPRCSAGSSVSGRRWRACALATVRRSNCTCSFPAYSFHEDSRFREAIEGINRTRFTSPYSR